MFSIDPAHPTDHTIIPNVPVRSVIVQFARSKCGSPWCAHMFYLSIVGVEMYGYTYLQLECITNEKNYETMRIMTGVRIVRRLRCIRENFPGMWVNDDKGNTSWKYSGGLRGLYVWNDSINFTKKNWLTVFHLYKKRQIYQQKPRKNKQRFMYVLTSPP